MKTTKTLRSWVHNKSLRRLAKITLLPVLCYLPAYVLVLFSFKTFELLTINKAEPPMEAATTAQKLTNLEERLGIKNDPKKGSFENRIESLENQVAIASRTPQLKKDDVNQKYVEGLIEKEARMQADKAAADAIDKAKSELFSAISFPVLFAIASIFAAFAVKDILIEILKSDEREKLEKELRSKLRQDLLGEISKAMNEQPLARRIQSLEISVNWLAHESALKNVRESISKITSATEEGNGKHSILAHTLSMLDKSGKLFDKSFVNFHNETSTFLKEAQYGVLQLEVTHNNMLSSDMRQHLNDKIEEIKKNSYREDMLPIYSSERVQGIYEAQLNLLFNRLDRMTTNSDIAFSKAIEEFKIWLQRSEDDILNEEETRKRESEDHFRKLEDEPIHFPN